MSKEDREIMAEAPREEAAARAEHEQMTAEVSQYRDVQEMTKKQRQLEKQRYESYQQRNNPLVG